MGKNEVLRCGVVFTPEIAQFRLGDFAIKCLDLHCTLREFTGQAIVTLNSKILNS